MKLAFESKLNILLSELLNQMGVTSHSEYLGQGRKDVLIYHQGLAIVLEGSYEKQDAEKDAKKRIEQLAADVALAVHYPKCLRGTPGRLGHLAVRGRRAAGGTYTDSEQGMNCAKGRYVKEATNLPFYKELC